MADYPEHAKLEAVAAESQAIGDFLGWMEEQKILLSKYGKLGELHPYREPKEKLLAQFFGIDAAKLEAEKRAMLDEFKATNDTAYQLRRQAQEYTQTPELLDALEQFRVMRQKIKRPLTSRALQLICTELNKLSGGVDSVKVAILEQSITNAWRGVFPLKGGVRRGAGQHGNTKPDGTRRNYESDFGALGE